MNPEEVRQKFERLERLVSMAGYEHEQTLRDFRSIINALRVDSRNPYAREKLRSAAGWAVELFSERKHRRRDTATTTGAETLKSFIREDLFNAQRNIDVVAGG